MQNQGLLAITFFESISFVILLILYFLLDRDRPARFFKFWIAGWTALTIFSALRILSIIYASDVVRLIAVECYPGWYRIILCRRLGIHRSKDTPPRASIP